jgi:hypothetical protein
MCKISSHFTKMQEYFPEIILHYLHVSFTILQVASFQNVSLSKSCIPLSYIIKIKFHAMELRWDFYNVVSVRQPEVLLKTIIFIERQFPYNYYY